MINFIKNDKYVSIINIIVILTFIIFKISYIWFLVVELFLISLYLIFMIFRFYLRSKVENKELKTINKLLKLDFDYKDYSDIYEEKDNFDLEIIGYKKLLNVVLINFLRMDNKLNLESYNYLELGEENLKNCINDNEVRKQNYDLVSEAIKIIKKYYNKNCVRKDNIKKYNKLLIILIILSIISLSFVVIYIINKNDVFYSIISSIFIVILFIVNIFLSKNNK